MKFPPQLLLLSFFAFCSVFGSDEKIVEMAPYEVSTSPFGYWGFTVRTNYKSSLIPNKFDRVKNLEVITVFKGGVADRCGLQTGDRIVEFDGKRNLKKKEIIEIIGERSVGEFVDLKVIQLDGKECIVHAQMKEFPDFDELSFCTYGIKVTIEGVNNWTDIKSRGSDKVLHVKKNEVPLFDVNLTTNRTIFILSDNTSYPLQTGMNLKFDENLSYELKYN